MNYDRTKALAVLRFLEDKPRTMREVKNLMRLAHVSQVNDVFGNAVRAGWIQPIGGPLGGGRGRPSRKYLITPKGLTYLNSVREAVNDPRRSAHSPVMGGNPLWLPGRAHPERSHRDS